MLMPLRESVVAGREPQLALVSELNVGQRRAYPQVADVVVQARAGRPVYAPLGVDGAAVERLPGVGRGAIAQRLLGVVEPQRHRASARRIGHSDTEVNFIPRVG